MSRTATQGTIERNMNPKEVDQALAMRLTSLNINQVLGSSRGVAADYGRLAVLYGARGDLDSAESMLMQAVEIERTLGRKDGKLLAPILGKLAAVYLRSGHPQQAEPILEKANKLYDDLGIATGRADTLGHLGIVYTMRDKPGQAEITLMAALKINLALNRRTHQADNYANLANLYWSQGHLPEARACYQEAHSLFAQTGQPRKVQRVALLLNGLRTHSADASIQ